jgi:hypothetical protein
MRVLPEQVEFCNWLQLLGDGLLPRYEGLARNSIRLPEDLVLNQITVSSAQSARTSTQEDNDITRLANEQDLIDFVFEKPINKQASFTENRVILAPLNEDVLRINESILDQIDGNKLVLSII